jgi:hypothetical protein
MSSDGSPPIDGGINDPAEGAGVFGTSWDRRTFLKSAALGTAAAAMYQGGSLFAPLAAYADDLSALNCTANDVRIPGPAQILNEPCNCTGTFNANVQFRVINNTGTTRYCVTVHFCPVTLSDGTIFAPGDVIIGDVPAKSDALYQVTIPNYPCGQGLLCFGARGSDPDGGFPKGAACPTGQCCTTVSWDVNPGCPSRVLASKCRHQQVCIQGRGHTTVDCDAVASGNQNDCTVTCGSTAHVKVCTTNSSALGPFRFQLGSQSYQGQAGETCHTFDVVVTQPSTTLTATVTDASGCASTASVTLRSSTIQPTITVSGQTNCDGNLTFRAAATGFTGCTPAWTIDGTAATANSDGSLSYRDLDGSCHTIGVTLTCGGCSGTASKTVSQCVHTTLNCTPPA